MADSPSDLPKLPRHDDQNEANRASWSDGDRQSAAGPPERPTPPLVHGSSRGGGVGPATGLGRAATLIAWLAIAAIVIGVALAQNWPATTSEQKADDQIAVLVLEIQGRYFIGVDALMPEQSAALASQLGALESGSPRQRLRAAALYGELDSPEAALESLDRLDSLVDAQSTPIAEADADAIPLLRRVYDARLEDASVDDALTEDERSRVAERVGWLGELAMAAPDDPRRRDLERSAIRFFVTLIAMFAVALALGVAGGVGLIIFLVMWIARSTRFGIRPPLTPTGVHAETFALWLLLFIAAPMVMALVKFGPSGPKADLVLTMVVFLASLLALAWPVVRGIPWSTLRRDIGLHTGRGVIAEIACGLATYAMTLPLLIVGLAGFLVLSGIESAIVGATEVDPLAPTSAPAHPILVMVADGDRLGLLLIFLLAAVAAPLVEETMFRGVLHRHLRGVFAKWGTILSAIVSALIGGFMFAIVHPQGYVAVPLLMAMAVGFALGREWRDSLIAPMVAHAINNFAVVLLMAVAFG